MPCMATIERSVDILVPVRTAYDQWTQVTRFPEFLRHVVSVRRMDDRHQVWQVRFGRQVREFEAEIVEQIPDKRIAWRSVRGMRHSGVVTFHRLNDQRCRVMLQLDYEPEGLVERLGVLLAIPRRAVAADLRRLAAHIEGQQGQGGGDRSTVLNKDDAHAAPDGGGRAHAPAGMATVVGDEI